MKIKIKIKSKKYPGKFIYGEISEINPEGPLVILTSGLSGSMDLPLFMSTTKEFKAKGVNILKLSFCTDLDEVTKKPKALALKNMSFSVYLAELKNVIDDLHLDLKYKKIFLLGHSFGSIISILFLSKYKKNYDLILWDQSHLPWDKKEMSRDFVFNPKTNLYREKETDLLINKTFYKELVSTDILKIFSSLKKNICVIAAEGSAEEDAKKYWQKIKDREKSEFHIIKKANHLFSSKNAQKELFGLTLNFIERLKKR
ncbi:MAG: hypothetical protein COV08_02710 [Candidatus Vogelbacteria bacterium CG10_big_fil_rev_8_21_14_0_10_49_38]|uniref:Serine aminopeptidase S33 domain-containing protein n=1 Tax=Candidatus Vogelbacteria bacterium CG10_big_fil_rev_8_21_14_0_10_49_38 TaxID=1975043 RepID=A0A2H0RJA1_9BACT|nr:MAG: hypothetical protein BK006_02725 [bacterium CG10_49_38]PIR45855.1 MAG: hypothetical protein COV08_02710 [Candidatus Vogelbacteria bacterium CG10_big_fil_rev_8_21_14_0_10_49_38]